MDNAMIDSGKWKINQCGFKQDHCTEDDLFVFKSINESYALETSTNIHAAFVFISANISIQWIEFICFTNYWKTI